MARCQQCGSSFVQRMTTTNYHFQPALLCSNMSVAEEQNSPCVDHELFALQNPHPATLGPSPPRLPQLHPRSPTSLAQRDSCNKIPPAAAHVLLSHFFADPPGHLGGGDVGSGEEEEHLTLHQDPCSLSPEEGPSLHASRHFLDRRGVHVTECRDLRGRWRRWGGGVASDKDGAGGRALKIVQEVGTIVPRVVGFR